MAGKQGWSFHKLERDILYKTIGVWHGKTWTETGVLCQNTWKVQSHWSVNLSSEGLQFAYFGGKVVSWSPTHKKISRTNHHFLFVNRIVGWQMISLPSKHWFQINIPGKGSLKRSGRTFQRINVKLQLLLFKPVGGGRQEQDDTFQSWTSWCYLSRPFQKNNRNFCWLTARKEIILTQLSYWLFPHVVWQDKKLPESKN